MPLGAGLGIGMEIIVDILLQYNKGASGPKFGPNVVNVS